MITLEKQDIASALENLLESTRGTNSDELESYFKSITTETLDKYNSTFDWLYDHAMIIAEERQKFQTNCKIVTPSPQRN